jgi:hypothetical protein
MKNGREVISLMHLPGGQEAIALVFVLLVIRVLTILVLLSRVDRDEKR